MNHEFDFNLLEQDLKDIWSEITGFFNSFGPTKTQYSFKEELKIKYGLWKVELGPVKIIKIIITTIVFLLMFFILFLNADIFFKIVTAFLFILFYGWLWGDELADELKNAKISIPGKVILGLTAGIGSIFAKKEEKKK